MGSCCSTDSTGMVRRIDTMELSSVEDDGVASSSPKGSKRWIITRKKGRGERVVGDRDVMSHHQVEVEGRLVGNGGSQVACLYTQQGKKGTNQDAMLVLEDFSSRSDTVFCGVFDGHGPFGHMVAKKVRDSLPDILCTQWKANSGGDLSKTENSNGNSHFEEPISPSIDDEWRESMEVQDTENLPDMYAPLKRSLLKAFKLMDKELRLHPTIDCFCSGSTAVTLIKQGQNLVLGNVGDSRAVLATRDKDNSLIAVQLTVDLKPDLPRESARIHQCKGRVFALQDEPEVARVWLPNNDSPGLAMARAFGDFCLKDFGLISVPDVYYRQITEKDKFIILATDGVWDVLSNKEAIDIVASAPSHTTAARALVDCAVRAWRLKYPTSKNDDCAVVCLFLEQFSVPAEVVTETEVIESKEDEKMGRMETAESNIVDVEIADPQAIAVERLSSDLELCDPQATALEHSTTIRNSNEIVPVLESTEKSGPVKMGAQSKRSLAECISTEEDWSALEGVTRVNSLLSLPRLLSGDKRSSSWRKKWL